MRKHMTMIKISFRLNIGAAAVVIILSAGCRPSSESGHDSPASNEVAEAFMPDEFHADNDIAMTMRSLADALKVGEPLDSTLYDFQGILTDGQGSPLYTDVQGSPGQWEVDVLDDRNVIIRNVYLGDLLPADLESYLLQSLRIDRESIMDFTAHDAVDDDETEITVYDFDGGYLRFEVRAGIAPNGLEGPMLSIVMSADPPVGVEKQTTALAQTSAKP